MAKLDFEDTMPFGKYKGQTVGYVCDEDPNYIVWAVNNTQYRFAQDVLDYVEGE